MKNTPTNYVLIDLENVQPTHLELLSKHPFKVFVFVGASQTKIPTALAVTLQALGKNGTYIQISGNGKNALDFHIAAYLGELASQDSDGIFHIISKDTGFDPLIKHMRDRNIRIQRENDLASIPLPKMCPTASHPEKIEAIVEKLNANQAQSRPRKESTLSNAINSWFIKQLEEDELHALIQSLKSKKYITVKDGNISYNLPKPA
jgi:hypothetical protein